MPQATLDDVIGALENVAATIEESAKKESPTEQLDDIKQSLFRIEELLGQIAEALVPDAPMP